MRPLALLVVLALAVTTTVPAQAKPGGSSVTYLESELLFLELGFFSAAPKIRKGGKLQDLGFFGQNYDRIFAGSPEALTNGRVYRNLRISGFTLSTIGMALLLTDIILLAAETSAAINKAKTGYSRIKPLGWGLLIGGAVVGVTGALLVAGAGSYLSKAVRHYNDDVFKRARMRWSFTITPLDRGALAGIVFAY